MRETVTTLVGIADFDRRSQLIQTLESNISRFSSKTIAFDLIYPATEALHSTTKADLYVFFISQSFEYSSDWCKFARTALSEHGGERVFAIALNTFALSWKLLGATLIPDSNKHLENEDWIQIASQIHLAANCIVEDQRLIRYAALMLGGSVAMGTATAVITKNLFRKHTENSRLSFRTFVIKDLNHAQASLRTLFKVICRTDSDLDALMLDYFPDAAKVRSDGMDQTRKYNLVFEYYDIYTIYSVIWFLLQKNRQDVIEHIGLYLSNEEQRSLLNLHRIVAKLQNIKDLTVQPTECVMDRPH